MFQSLMKRCRRVIGRLAFFSLGLAPIICRAEVNLIVPSGYLPQIPVLVRVELRTADGLFDRAVWDAEAILSTDQPGVTLSTNRLVLRNGLGSCLVLFTGGGDFNLTAAVNGQETTRAVQDLSGAPVTTVSGTLPGTSTTWSGVVRVTNDVTVPAGHTLTIESNSWVLVDGVGSGSTAPDLLIDGTIESLGTELHPVTITCSSPDLNWGQIRHNDAQPSLYRYTSITKAGRAPGEGHTGTGPAIRPSNSTIVFESCTIGDLTFGTGTIGKIMQADGSTLTFRDCLLTRARMGPEISGTGLVCTNTYFLEMRGPDDADGIYPHASGGRPLQITGCVFAFGDDDGIDTLDSVVELEDCIIRDWSNRLEDAKGISVFNGATYVRRCVIVDCTVGIAAKWSGGSATLVTINHSTLTGNLTNAYAQRKSNAPGPFVDYRITNSVLVGGDAVHSDFGPTNFTIVYSDMSESWPGTGNITDDPLFVDEPGHDYHLRPGSPCVDSGDPDSALDPDGTRADMGVYPIDQSAQAPIITQQPHNQLALECAEVTFSVTASGTEPLVYQWLRNGIDLAGATNASLVLPAARLSQHGETYSVRVSNSGGTVTSREVLLYVKGDAPSLITTQPESQSVVVGADAIFDVATDAACRQTFQWLFGGQPLAGQTNQILRVSNVLPADAGDYSVLVLDPVSGELASEAATLTVLGVPTLANPQFDPDGTFSFSFSGVTNRSYEVQASTNLADWETVAILNLTSESMAWTDTNAPNFRFRFYRVQLPP
jgi:hypothetical protein